MSHGLRKNPQETVTTQDQQEQFLIVQVKSTLTKR